MSVLFDNVTNYIWHAFTALQSHNKSGFVPKTKLKVLTANIGSHLELSGSERGLEHFGSSSTLPFGQFNRYLQQEVFAALPDRLPLIELREYEERISHTCWTVCHASVSIRRTGTFTDSALFQLFRIFCLLADLTERERDGFSVLIHPAEAARVYQTFARSVGSIFDEDDFLELGSTLGAFPLATFIAVLEARCLRNVPDTDAVTEAVHDLYQTLVEDVIKKGILFKKGYIFPTMREYWFVLRPSELSYYKSKTEKDRCGSLIIDKGSKVEAKSGYKIVLHTSERTFELATTDHMTRLQWMSALQIAIEHSGGSQTYQRIQVSKRRSQRRGRMEEAERARNLLQQERTARRSAEGHAKQLEAVVREETRRLTELELIKQNLERLLDEETQAKRDEEIVRALQARILAEEWEKREELENLQREQRTLLDEERTKRKEYEALQQQKEADLIAAQERLRQLQEERLLLDDQLKSAMGKINLSEEKREVLEARLIAVAPSLRDGDKVRRAHSFVPSTKDRPIFLQVRSSTLQRTHK